MRALSQPRRGSPSPPARSRHARSARGSRCTCATSVPDATRFYTEVESMGGTKAHLTEPPFSAPRPPFLSLPPAPGTEGRDAEDKGRSRRRHGPLDKFWKL